VWVCTWIRLHISLVRLVTVSLIILSVIDRGWRLSENTILKSSNEIETIFRVRMCSKTVNCRRSRSTAIDGDISPQWQRYFTVFTDEENGESTVEEVIDAGNNGRTLIYHLHRTDVMLSAVHVMARCLSVRLSQVGVLSKRLNMSSHKPKIWWRCRRIIQCDFSSFYIVCITVMLRY